jgi:ABC-type multidrug transport system fused ATPase/permease subunit
MLILNSIQVNAILLNKYLLVMAQNFMGGIGIVGFVTGNMDMNVHNLMFHISTFLIMEFIVFWIAIGDWKLGLMTLPIIVLIQSYLGRLTENLWSFASIVRTFYDSFADAQEMALVLDTPYGIQDKSIIVLKDLKGEIIFEDVTYIYDKNNIKVARELKKVADVKNMQNIKARFIIIDSNQLMFMLLDDEKFHPNYDIGVWINTEFFAQALEQLFELAWKDMKPAK